MFGILGRGLLVLVAPVVVMAESVQIPDGVYRLSKMECVGSQASPKANLVMSEANLYDFKSGLRGGNSLVISNWVKLGRKASACMIQSAYKFRTNGEVLEIYDPAAVLGGNRSCEQRYISDELNTQQAFYTVAVESSQRRIYLVKPSFGEDEECPAGVIFRMTLDWFGNAG